MPHSRFFIDSALNVDDVVLLEGDEAHHLQRVMRKKVGDQVELVNGCNQLALCKILAFEKKGIQLKTLSLIEKQMDHFPIILCQALPRLNRLETIVEKGTELGMTELRLFSGELSEKKELSATQLQRLKIISIAAMKQCGRLDLPKISLKQPLLGWQSLDYPAFFGDLSEEAPPFLSCFQKKEGILFFIGPESGFTEQEENHLRALGAQGVRLHPSILRTDTAPLVALALIFNKI
jgi:16S rRNA (uracil1498-N3)-methyltransferase